MSYLIVGAGPSGLTIAWLLAKCGAPCTIIESAADIGGCHRVNRQRDKFSEHGPRIYTSTYKTFMRLLKDMDVDFHDIFTPYKFTISSIGGRTISNLTAWELFELTKAYIGNIIGLNYKNTSMREFTAKFTPESVDYIDRLCRLTDGASIDNYSVYKFLQLMNQQGTIYQPKDPNDKLLFRTWSDQLRALGVKIILDAKATRVLTSANRATGVEYVVDGQVTRMMADNVILAVPPKPLLLLVKNTTAFTQNMTKWAGDNSYSDFISVCFEYNTRVNLKSVWGFPQTKWGLAHIVLNDYFESYKDKTLISTGVTNVDAVGDNGKTARNSSDEELKDEIFRQLKMSYPDLPAPDFVTIGSRIGQETAYIQGSSDGSFIPFVTNLDNLYTLGTHNGHAQFAFTSMETAVTNAHALAHELDPATRKYPIINSWTLNQILFCVVLVRLVLIVLAFYWIKYCYKKLFTKVKN